MMLNFFVKSKKINSFVSPKETLKVHLISKHKYLVLPWFPVCWTVDDETSSFVQQVPHTHTTLRMMMMMMKAPVHTTLK